MFKNHAVQMKLVKATEGDLVEIPDLPKFELPSKEDVEDVTFEIIKNSALAAIGVIVVGALARTLSEIAIDRWTD